MNVAKELGQIVKEQFPEIYHEVNAALIKKLVKNWEIEDIQKIIEMYKCGQDVRKNNKMMKIVLCLLILKYNPELLINHEMEHA